jgi:ankyrin repeat protein
MQRIPTITALMACFVVSAIAEKSANGSELSLAIRNDQIAKVEEIINADPNLLAASVDRHGTPLHFAVQLKKLEMTKLLLKKGSQVNAVSERGVTPLYYAVQNLDIEVAKILLAAGANADHRNAKKYTDNPTPIDVAVKSRSLELVKLLHKHGADINGLRAVHSAVTAAKTKPEILTFMLANKADPTRSYALTHAAVYADAKVLEQMLNARDDLHKTAHYDEYLLKLAAGDLAKVKLLVERGISPNREGFRARKLPLLAAVAQQGNVKVLAFLLSKGFTIDSPHADLSSTDVQLRALNEAINCRHLDMVKALLKEGVKPTFCALIAVGDKQAVAAELKRNPDALDTHTKHNQSANLLPLHVAVQFRQHEILAMLVEKATPEQLNASSWSIKAKPLHCAVEIRDAKAAKVLLEAGANPNSQLNISFFGVSVTPLDLLEENDYELTLRFKPVAASNEQLKELSAVLKKHGAKLSGLRFRRE